MKPNHLSLAASQNSLPDGGFRNIGEFLIAVSRAAGAGPTDKRLVRAPAGASEVDPTAGGFLVPQQYAEKIISSIYSEASIAPLCDTTETTEPFAGYSEPAYDESSRADGSRWGGSLGYWLGEADAVPLSRPKFRQNNFVPHKLILLSQVTSEMFSDSNLLEAAFERAMRAEGAFKLDAAIFSGSGAGLPLGILNAPATIAVAKDSDQQASTISSGNIASMWSRLPVPCRRRAVWLVCEDAESQLEAIGNASGQALYMPQGSAGNAYPLLKGRPVLPIEQASPLGTVGDIVLADMSAYRVVQSSPKFALSSDVAFDTDELVFRFVLRVAGKPAYASPITPFNGSA
jgi:HK97 family phage major capsid protein